MVACCLVALLAGCREEATSAQVCATPRPDIAASRPEGVIVAGTGAGLSPLKMLARAYAEQTDDPKERVFIPVSIGTGGGLRALAAGAINAAVPHAELESTALDWAREILTKSPTAIRMLKFAFNAVDDGLVGQQIFAGEATRLAYGTDEAVEGRDAFLEKREPDWSPFPWQY